MNEEHAQTTTELAAALKAVTATNPEEPASFTIYPHEEFDIQSLGLVRLEDGLDALVNPDNFVAFEHQESPRLYLGAKGHDTLNGACVFDCVERVHNPARSVRQD